MESDWHYNPQLRDICGQKLTIHTEYQVDWDITTNQLERTNQTSVKNFFPAILWNKEFSILSTGILDLKKWLLSLFAEIILFLKIPFLFKNSCTSLLLFFVNRPGHKRNKCFKEKIEHILLKLVDNVNEEYSYLTC